MSQNYTRFWGKEIRAFLAILLPAPSRPHFLHTAKREGGLPITAAWEEWVRNVGGLTIWGQPLVLPQASLAQVPPHVSNGDHSTSVFRPQCLIVMTQLWGQS